ncbi:tetratricopeptide (TPR) repeat protein [Parvibaculum indicum]|uniref:hypothetical protein n=1 Tax=Parvibaculum indicum TaxID=562969 RepID=UPI00141EFB9B|nr:hypothetical protein [Parvibaculum indicum]NIJ42887.1 tetratricopeptide (TPR) repeat protein [Parvibaculum indicum]
MRWVCFLLAMLMAQMAHPATAMWSDLASARAAFDDGAFSRAAAAAREVGTAEGYTLAAHAEMARGDLIEPKGKARLECYRTALADARKALASAPDDPDAHLVLAIALGFVARGEGGLEAHMQGLGEEARKHIDIALKLAPDNPWAHAALGGWNLQIAYAGGSIGEAIYGASVKAGRRAYEDALRLDPKNTAIAYQYAVQLLGLDGDAHRRRAAELLDRVVAHRPVNALERLLRQSAESLKQALDRGETGEAMRLAEARLGDTR